MDFLEFAQLLFNQELLASEGTVREVLTKYQLATTHGHEYVGLMKRDKTRHTAETSRIYKGTDGKLVGVLPVKGALVYEETGWEALCGMSSYEGLQNKATHMIVGKGVKNIILEINSGGGMAYGCFETAQFVRNLADKHGAKITAYVDGVAFSGGYAWCCIADEVIVNPMAKVGSIGVVLPLVNTSERDKKEGIERIYVTAGKSKVPFDKDGKFTKEALSKIEKDVMVTYDMFVNHVASNRNLSVEAVMDTEANTFGTEEALSLGLIDSVMTKEQFYEHIGNFDGDVNMSIHVQNQGAQAAKDGESNSVLVSQLSTQITTLQSEAQVAADALTAEKNNVAKLTADLAAEKAKVTNLESQVAGLTSEKASLVLEGRKEKISAFVAADEVEDHLDMVDGFSQEKFDKYVANLEKQHAKVEADFEPVGVDAKVEPEKVMSVDEQAAERVRQKQAK